MKIVDIGKNKETDGINVKERLQQAIEMTEARNVVNLAIVMVTDDGGVVDCWANGNSPFNIVGGLESLKIEFLNNHIESRLDND